MKKMFKALLAGSVALAPVIAFAAIDNTHHDMIYLIASREKCAYCHSKTLGANDATYGKVGGFCVQVCHIAGSGPAAAGRAQVVPDSAGIYSFNEGGNAIVPPGAEVLDPAILKSSHGWDTLLIVDAAGEANDTAMIGTNWPHVETGVDLECTSCHAVHDNTNPPFLNAAYSGFCERCHTTKLGDYTDTTPVAPYTAGNHPAGMAFNTVPALAYDGTNASQKTNDTATKMNGRTLRYPGSANGPSPANLYAGFTAVAVGATPQLTANAAGTNWNLAGHVLETAAAGTLGLPVQAVGAGSANNRFGCYSCHNAHQSVAVPAINDIDAPRTINPQNVLLLGGSATDGGSDACYGCHGDTANPNDAGKSNFGHPINNETVQSDVNGWTVPLTANGALPVAGGGSLATAYDADGTPKCLSCHDVHNGVNTGLMSIRYAATAGGSACTACHAASFTANVADSHHPGVAGTDYTQAGNGSFVNPNWRTIDNNGNLVDGLSCPDCHVGDGNSLKRSTGHNWLP